MVTITTLGQPPGPTELADHVWELAMQNAIELDVRERHTHGRAWARSRKVRISRVTTLRRYFIALHELGHLVARRRTVGTRLDREARAWQWALDHALEPPNTHVWQLITESLRSYLTWAENRQDREHGRPILPVEGDEFSALLERAQRRSR